MTYATFLVHLDGAKANTAVLNTAAALAKHYGAKVIGIAACEPVQLGECDGYMDGEFAVVERDIVTDELARAKAEFQAHAALQPHVLEWRSIPALVNVADVVAEQARCADLVITSVGPKPGDRATHADAGELILGAGRPVLVVPDGAVTTDFRTIVVAWSDTRECRRAVMDALPMLHNAARVIIAEASRDPAAARDGIADVAAWLGRHGIRAERINSDMKGSGTLTLAAIADAAGADLIVAGAYGHSRIREWAFGGVTRDLLLHEQRCALLSH